VPTNRTVSAPYDPVSDIWRRRGALPLRATTTDALEACWPESSRLLALLRAHASPTVVWAGLVDADAPTFGGAD